MDNESAGEVFVLLVLIIIFICFLFWYESCQDKAFQKEHSVTNIEDVTDVPDY